MVGTYNSYERDGKTPTYGGYSDKIVTDENFVLRIPSNFPLAGAAPLLCAGITTYSPLTPMESYRPGHKVGVVGLGGLGHMAVKLAAAMGAEVTVLSTSVSKEADAKKLGAHKFVVTKDKNALGSVKNYFDIIIDTVSAQHDYNTYLDCLTWTALWYCWAFRPMRKK